MPCTIVIPKGTPSIKVRVVSRLGAKVLLHGDDFDEAKFECALLVGTHGLIFVPPYDDPLVLAGQGTVGMEILKQLKDAETLDAKFASVGGGGLISGIAEYVKRISAPTLTDFTCHRKCVTTSKSTSTAPSIQVRFLTKHTP